MNIHFTFSHNFIIIISIISLHVSRVCNLRSIFITITISSRKHLNANRLPSTSCGSQEIFIMIISNLSMMLLPIKECLDRDEIQRCCLTVAQVLLTRHQCTDIVPASIFIYSSLFSFFLTHEIYEILHNKNPRPRYSACAYLKIKLIINKIFTENKMFN